MALKLIVALIRDDLSDRVMAAARKAGATGSTIINSARGEGSRPRKTFLGLDMTTQTDVLLFVVDQSCADAVLAAIDGTADFDGAHGAGLAFQVDVEKAIGVFSRGDVP